MQIMVRILMPILVVIVVGSLFSRMNKSNGEELIKDLSGEHIVVHLPKINLWIGLLMVAVCSTSGYFMFFFPKWYGRLVGMGYSTYIDIGRILYYP